MHQVPLSQLVQTGVVTMPVWPAEVLPVWSPGAMAGAEGKDLPSGVCRDQEAVASTVVSAGIVVVASAGVEETGDLSFQ